jgi:hypothetical protein
MWAQESHNVGKAAYLDATVNEKLTEEYIQRNVPVIEQQIVKGGVRLAKLIEFIFTSREKEEASLFLK